MAKETKRAAAAAPGDGLALGETSAGAGVLGLIGFTAVFLVAMVFFITESFFLAMTLTSIALLIYVAGGELGKLLLSSLLIFFSSRHLHPNAVYLQETVLALRRQLRLRKDEAGFVKAGPIEPGTHIKLPDNPLVRDIQAVLRREKGSEYTQYIAHQYYVDCREMYDHFHGHHDFVAGVMPLFGLVGTVVGLIGMFDALGSNTSVENLAPQLAISLKCTLYGAILATFYMIVASRFELRTKGLEYDYDILLHSLEVLVENEAVIEVEA